MTINPFVAAVKMFGCSAAAIVVGYIEAFDEVVDQVITQSHQLGQSHLRLLVALRWHGELKRMLAQATSGDLLPFLDLLASSSLGDASDFR